MPITRLLIANRGEIACRIARSARARGIETVAVFSEADAGGLHLSAADIAVPIGPAAAAESYLSAETILDAARASGADAIHPGYGFLSENPGFAEAVIAAGLTWVGPPPAAIRAMGLKDEAKRRMEAAGVPVVPGYHGAEQAPDLLAAEAARIGYPVLIKAAAGGGGKGMRRVEHPAAFAEALERAQSEAASAFANPRVLVEKWIDTPRHIEVQVFADRHGNTVHLFERDCSAQRRHQKVIEEAPAPGMTEALRTAMCAAAVRAAEAVRYEGAGTVEFIVDGARMSPDAFFFMEMNTRLQVEHPVTEAVTGTDLVDWQLQVAEGAPLPLAQPEIRLRGHAVEARIYAEDPAADFAPRTGRASRLRWPEAVRVETGLAEGGAVTPHYDPMIAKLIAEGPSRAAAFARLAEALDAAEIEGLTTNLAFLRRLLEAPEVAEGRPDTGLIGRRLDALTAPPAPEAADLALAAAGLTGLLEPAPAIHWRAWGTGRSHAELVLGEARFAVSAGLRAGTEGLALKAETPLGPAALQLTALGGGLWQLSEPGGATRRVRLQQSAGRLTLIRSGERMAFTLADPLARDEASAAEGDAVRAPLPGVLKGLSAAPGDHVSAGQRLAVMEAMKMEHSLLAPRDGVVAEVHARDGEQVDEGALIVSLEPEPAPEPGPEPSPEGTP